MRALVLILLLLGLTFNVPAASKTKRVVSAKHRTYPRATAEPEVYALWDVDGNRLLESKNGQLVHPMASITKLMTVFVTLESGASLDESIVVASYGEHSSRIRNGMTMTRRELIELALVSSDNVAARSLAEGYAGGYGAFVSLMNATAKRIGMTNTHYEDSTGLLPQNVSNGEDIMRLTLAVSKHNIVNYAASIPIVNVHATIKRKNVNIVGHNTNPFVGKLDIAAAKTGFTNAAGRCLTMIYNINGNRYALVVLGATDVKQRSTTVKNLIDKSAKMPYTKYFVSSNGFE
jgi:D-alanyl-D-alanine endopeptidase (penicillin-binding protein 7)